MTPRKYEAHAPAKINLALHVIGQRSDGYHDLDSLVVFARRGDVVRMVEANVDSFSVTGTFANHLSGSGSNLVCEAHTRFLDAYGKSSLPHLAIELEKNLPITAGIGGGSADAAAALRLFAEIAGAPLDSRLLEVATRLGADVPMCLETQPKRVQRIGDRLTDISGVPACHALLLNPLKPASTPEVFRRLQVREHAPLPEPLGNWGSLDGLVAWLSRTRNDLETTAIELVPEIKLIVAQMKAMAACRFARMSGSGATVFGLFETEQAAEDAARQLRSLRPNDWISVVEICPSGKSDTGQ